MVPVTPSGFISAQVPPPEATAWSARFTRAECQKECGEAAPLHGRGTLLNRSVIM
jgi:hypothetical protein